jgi:uncharacterized surface protein with fasciclin (FAS1) repeats
MAARKLVAMRRALGSASIAVIAAVGLSACTKTEIHQHPTATSTTSVIVTSTVPATTTASAAPAGQPVGPGCADYEQQVPTGPGSVAGMAKDPVTVAASNNPQLTTLTQALSGRLNPDVNLVDTLNKGEYTVFAPTDKAFAKLDAATMDRFKADATFLNGILTYHVVNGQLTPAQVDGVHQTLDANATLTVAGTANDLKVNDAGVTCGGIGTANAQVYMIDTVLIPPPLPIPAP